MARLVVGAKQDGFETAKHLYFTHYSLAIEAAIKGQGVALGATVFVEQELENGRLMQVGQTCTTSGDYVLLEAQQRSSAAVRAAFVQWIGHETSGPSSRLSTEESHG